MGENEQINRILESVKNELEKQKQIYKEKGRKFIDTEYVPQNPKHREKEITHISKQVIEFIINRVSGSFLIYGNSGTGKTMSFKVAMQVTKAYLEKPDIKEYKVIFITAKGTDITPLMSEICRELDIKAPSRGISFKDYINLIKQKLQSTYVHICIDEFDNLLLSRNKEKAEDLIYYFTRTEGLSLTIITNRINLAKEIQDARVFSSLNTLNTINFRDYDPSQCYDILIERTKMAFNPNFIPDNVLQTLSKHIAVEGGDIRKGLSVLGLCAKYAEDNSIFSITPEIIKDIIEKYDILKDGENLLKLSISGKLILASMYSLLLTNHANKLDSKDIFAKQDYYRSMLAMPGISRESHSVYLTKLSTSGIISATRNSMGGREGTTMLITLRYPRDAIKYMLNEDNDMGCIHQTIDGELIEIQKHRAFW
jgi:Cdc6-like AAA superfamily ATPase